MDAIKNITTRSSARELIDPHPSSQEMETVFKAALRAPDHAWLKPSRFIQITGNGRNKLSQIFIKTAHELNKELTETQILKYTEAPFRAPMIIILISNYKEHPKVPLIEQIISTGCAGQNILLALNALGYGGMWRTGTFAFNEVISKYLGLEKSAQVIGYIYAGTRTGKNKKIPIHDVKDYVDVWE
ncbi:MAG: nitroreductase family protein [SAR86 cluster bacterium]|nr:nitroreductase family protein [SAR86 cluster bacterium]